MTLIKSTCNHSISRSHPWAVVITLESGVSNYDTCSSVYKN